MSPEESKRLREQMGMTPLQLGQKLGYLSGEMVYYWESGMIPVPRLVAPLIIAMSQGFDVEVAKTAKKPRLPKRLPIAAE